MYAEHWRKLAWATFLGNFPILLVQHVYGALMNSFLLECATVFPIKNTFQPIIITFYFDLVPPFYFLKWNHFFSTFIPVLCESRHYFYYLLLREVCTNLQSKRFPQIKFDTKFECTGVLISKVTILKSTHLINIFSFWNCLSRNFLWIRLIIITLF